ncbi:hypothetical protein ACHQM5_004790 [Ranunculus cassubicifolius]
MNVVLPLQSICCSSNFFNKEITHNVPYITYRTRHSTVLSIRCEGNRRGRPRKNTAPDGNTPQSSNDESSNQEEIIALFRRIQTSIAKDGGSTAIKKRRSDPQKDRKAAENVLDVLRQSRNKIKDDKAVSKRQDIPKIKEEMEDVSATPVVNFRRPPSNFVKKSPIPPQSALREEVVEVASEEIEAGFEKMKVSELKELAKSRGIKGYSKLKKGELINLLRG